MRTPAATLPFTNGFYQSRALPLSAQRCVNYYINVSEVQTLSQENLYGTPGVTLIDSGEALEPNRGSHEMAGIPYFVNGNTLYRLNRVVDAEGVESFNVEALGFIPGEGRVSMADNGYQLCIVVPGVSGWIFTADPDTLDEITDAAWIISQTVVYLDGYFVFNATGSSIIFHSALRDGLSYNALDFAEAEADPDPTVALHVHNNVLYVMGSQTIEPYTNTGGLQFAFSVIRGGVINKGLRSTFGVVEFDQTFAFIGSGENEQPSIFAFRGGSVVELGTVPVDQLLQNASIEQLDEAFVFYHALNKAHFFGITAGSRTLVFDSTASGMAGRKVWHERSSRVKERDIQWRVSSIVQAYNRTWVGDLQDGRIGELRDDIYTEYDEVIIRQCTTQPFENSALSMRVSRLELTMNSGQGTLDQEARVSLDWSDTGGSLWGEKLSRGLGKAGQYQRRQIWRGLGRFPKTRVLRFSFSDNSDPSILKLEVNAK